MSWIATADKALTAEQARALTLAIRDKLTDLLPMIKQAYEGRADQALGYATWHDYCMAELSGLRIPLTDRPAAVAELRQNGMSTRAIGSALGIAQTQVVRDLARLNTNGSVEEPQKVVSLDGRERPATMPAREAMVEPATDLAATCEACGGPMDAGQYEAGFMRCDACDGDDAHTAVGWPHGRDGGCATCAELAAPTPVEMPAGQDKAEAALAAIDERTVARPRPPVWDPEERRQHEEEVQRHRDIEAARRHAASIVTDLRSSIVTIVTGCRLGETGLVNADMIRDLLEAIELLRGEI